MSDRPGEDASSTARSGARTPAFTSRRRFLLGGALALGAWGLAACSAPGPASGSTPVSSAPPPRAMRAPTPTATPTPTPTAAPPVVPAAHLRPDDPLGSPGFGAPTVMSVWAHYDDDLLFAGTRLQEAITAGSYVRSVFLTGGDAGRGTEYSHGREQGIRRAYDVMRGSRSKWTSEAVTLDTGAIVTVWRPVDSDRISIVFFDLPDGNLTGRGFVSTGGTSLVELADGTIPTLDNLTRTSSVTWPQLVDSIAILIDRFAPSLLLTHVPTESEKWSAGDHPDHRTTGKAARAAWQQAGFPVGLVDYAVGYPTKDLPANVTGGALVRKVDAFSAYAAGDSVVGACKTQPTCLALPRFGSWLQRQYSRTDAELFTP